jgi:hypothetical protein
MIQWSRLSTSHGTNITSVVLTAAVDVVADTAVVEIHAPRVAGTHTPDAGDIAHIGVLDQ